MGNINDTYGRDTADRDALVNYLQIPVAGLRNRTSGLLSSQTSSAYYWSSTPYGTNAYSLSFYSTYLYPQYNNFNRAYGFSVRCFKNASSLDTPLEAEITYSTTGATNSPVLATINFTITGVVIDNNSGSNSYLFERNGSFTFFFHDQKGNTGQATAEVNRILGTSYP